MALLARACLLAGEPGEPWRRHAIDDSSRGADGTRLGDVDGDGRLDVATAWEEGGLVRVAFNPGPARAREPWPVVTVGRVGSPEDAVIADLDGDGAPDVVSASEGDVRTVRVHWAPRERERIRDPAAWHTGAFPATRGVAQWMFCLPLQVDGRRGVDLVLGAKGEEGEVAWLESPEDPRDLGAWRRRRLREAGWIMALVALDADGDGDFDVLLSDRKGPRRGVAWLENPGPAGVDSPGQDRWDSAAWNEHAIGLQGREAMFIAPGDIDGDGTIDIAAAVRGPGSAWLRRPRSGAAWETMPLPFPAWAGSGKATAVGDMDLDGRADIVVSCEDARGRSGLFLLVAKGPAAAPEWEARDLSGPAGTKFDLVELIDIDADGDRDVLTSEESEGLGVVWYENPAPPRGR
jgi:hypothetical protein